MLSDGSDIENGSLCCDPKTLETAPPCGIRRVIAWNAFSGACELFNDRGPKRISRTSHTG